MGANKSTLPRRDDVLNDVVSMPDNYQANHSGDDDRETASTIKDPETASTTVGRSNASVVSGKSAPPPSSSSGGTGPRTVTFTRNPSVASYTSESFTLSDVGRRITMAFRETSMITRYNEDKPGVNTVPESGGPGSGGKDKYSLHQPSSTICGRCCKHISFSSSSSSSYCTNCMKCCFETPLIYCLLILFVVAICGGSIAFYVYAIMSLVDTSINKQYNLCHQSHVWFCILCHLIVGCLCTYNGNSFSNNEDHNEEKKRNSQSILLLFKGFVHCGLTGWAIYEYWFVNCVNELKGTLLYIILEIITYLDLVATGLWVLIMLVYCGILCGFCNSCFGLREQDSDRTVLRKAADKDDSGSIA